jgi:hypothetical protein
MLRETDRAISAALAWRISETILLLALQTIVRPAEAERVMSCQEFRTALGRAIEDDGGKIATQLDKAAGGFGPSISYEMTEIVGLQGRLICSNDYIFNFNATTRLSSDPIETGVHIIRFKELASAAICALSSPAHPLQHCTSLAETLILGAMNEYAKGRVGEVHGYEVGARLNGEAHIEIIAAANSLMLFLYPF